MKTFHMIMGLIIVLCFFQCDKNTTGPEKEFIEIHIPLNKTCVHACAWYSGSKDSLDIRGVEIFSVTFHTKDQSNDTTYYHGLVIHYAQYQNRLINVSTASNHIFPPVMTFTDTGQVVLSMDDQWVLYQYSNINETYKAFFKRNAVPDTTAPPTIFYSQLPVFPRRLKTNTDYTIYRPAGLLGDPLNLSRRFHVGEYQNWKDGFGKNEGLYTEVEHCISDMEPFIIKGIIDSHGVVISQRRDELEVTTVNQPEGTGEIMTFLSLNRRIVDYNNPDSVLNLETYADQVFNEGLVFFE